MTDAARAAGIGLTTGKRWRADAAVQQKIAACRQRMVDEATGRLAELATKAVGVLEDALGDETAAVRVRAALGILDRLLALRAAVELEARIAALEQAPAGGIRRVS